MSFNNSLDFGNLDFAENQDPRAACVLVLDCSSSMVEPRPGESLTPMDALNNGLDVLIREIHKDPLAKRRVELSFVTYGSEVSDPTPFKTIDEVVLPTLTASGVTSTGAAIVKALDAIQERKSEYKANGIQYFKPFCILISDGLATDDITEAARRVKEAEEKKSVAFFAVGVDGADLGELNKLSNRDALMLKGLNFADFFVWLSASQSAVSASNPGEGVGLPSPAGWAEL